MNARELVKRRIGEWVFGSALALGTAASFGGGGDLFGGQGGGGGGAPGHCTGTTTIPCQSNFGGTCSSGSTCICQMGSGPSGAQCESLQGGGLGTTCPTGCHPAMMPSKCNGGGVGMGPCYYPPP